MTLKDVLSRKNFKKCVNFHGHLCPGLSMGYRAATAGLDWLREKRAEDEELVAIVETDACGTDAVQVVTGCTFGKGNFICKDYGKTAFTFLSRGTGEGVRLSMKKGAFNLSERHGELLGKVMANSATDSERTEFRKIHIQRSHDILSMPLEDLFSVKPVHVTMPEKAKIEPSKPCAICGEPTMGSKLERVDGRHVCRGCVEEK